MIAVSRSPSLLLGAFGPRFLRMPVRLRVAELTNHVQVLGATNSGKSRWLAHLAIALIERGEGVTLIDPHGDASRLVLAGLVSRGVFADPAAYERITYLDLPGAASVGRYLPCNILEQPFDTPTTARLVLEAFRRAWPALENGVAPAFENALLAGVSVLCQHHLPIIFLHDLFTDAAWRTKLLHAVTDPTVAGFFARLDRWGSREQAMYLESTLRRAFLLSFSPVLRYSLGQIENRVGRFRERMDEGRSLIVNLALPDPDARRLMGCLLTVLMEQGALARAGTPAGKRGRNHTLILDEFAELSSQSGTAMQHILEQCRKFGLGLVLAHQSGGQLSPRLRDALAGVGTTILFRVGREDAEVMATRLGTINPMAIKHAGGERASHPLYVPMAEQWEAWTARIQGLRPRQMLVQRLPPKPWLARRLQARVSRLRTPDLPDPVVDPEAVATVEEWYKRHCFTIQPLVEWEMNEMRAPVSAPVPPARRRIRVGSTR